MSTLEDLIPDRDALLLNAMKHPGLHPKRNPDLEQAMKVVANEIEGVVVLAMIDRVQPVVQEVLDNYTLFNGDYADVEGTPEASDYESGLDDMFEECLEPYEKYLSADWLATHTIDSRLWDEDAVVKLSKSVGLEVFKQMSYGKSPSKVLSSAGFLGAEIEVYLTQHLAAKSQEQAEKMAKRDEQSIEDVVAVIREHIGNQFDFLDVYSNLELAIEEDDEILANGAGARLGLEDVDVKTLQLLQFEGHADAAQVVLDMVTADAPEKKKKTRAKKPRDDKGARQDVDGALNPKVLEMIKEHSAVKDTVVAQKLGVSRATYGNWGKGKVTFVPTNEQTAMLREQVVADVNGLLEALSLIDGTPLTAVA